MQANHPRADPLRHHGAGQHLTAGVPYPHQIAIDNPARLRILRMNSHRFAPGDGIALAQRGVVQLTVQTVGRMGRQQLQLPASALPCHSSGSSHIGCGGQSA